jgi:hypothetical protein
MKQPSPLVTDLRHELRETACALRAAQTALLAAHERAERAEQSAREAWAFARIALRTGRQG